MNLHLFTRFIALYSVLQYANASAQVVKALISDATSTLRPLPPLIKVFFLCFTSTKMSWTALTCLSPEKCFVFL